MKPKKTAWVLISMGICLLLSGIVLGKAVVIKGFEANGVFAMNKVVVSVKNQLDTENRNSFSLDDIKELAEQLNTNDITYVSQSGLISSAISANNSNYAVKVTGMNYIYPMFNKLAIEYGSFFTRKTEDEGGYVAVIEEGVAWNLFKTKNAVGKTVKIYNVPFKIIGVYKKDDSIIETLTDSGIANVFIPAEKMLELDSTARIKSFQVRTADTSTLDQNTGLVSAALQQIGKSPANYTIEDYNLKKALMEQKPMFIVFIMGILAILIFLVYIKSTVKEVSGLIRYNCRTDYLSNVIKKHALSLGISVLKIFMFIGCILLIWLGIKATFYIPPKYIADELINVSYYVNLFKSNVQSSISSLGYIASNTELVMNTVQSVLNWLFFVPLIPGFVLLYSGFVQLKIFDIDVTKAILYLGLIVSISLIILAAAAHLLGLPYVFDVKSLLVAWSFLALTAVRACKSIRID